MQNAQRSVMMHIFDVATCWPVTAAGWWAKSVYKLYHHRLSLVFHVTNMHV